MTLKQKPWICAAALAAGAVLIFFVEWLGGLLMVTGGYRLDQMPRLWNLGREIPWRILQELWGETSWEQKKQGKRTSAMGFLTN